MSADVNSKVDTVVRSMFAGSDTSRVEVEAARIVMTELFEISSSLKSIAISLHRIRENAEGLSP